MSTLGYLGVATLVLLLSVAAPAFAAVTSRVLRSDALTCNVVGSVAPGSNALTPHALAADAATSDGLRSNALTGNALTPNAAATAGSPIARLSGVAIEEVSVSPGIRP